MSIFVVLAAIAVYLGLALIFPHRKTEPKLRSGPTPDEVFRSNETSAPPTDAAQTPAPSAASSSGTSGVTANGGSGERSLTEAEARRIAEEVGRKVATQVAQQLLLQQQQRAAGQLPADAATAPTVSDADVHRIAQTAVQSAVDGKSAENGSRTIADAGSSVKAASERTRTKPGVAVRPTIKSAHPVTQSTPGAKSKTAQPAEANVAWWAPAAGAGSGLGLSFAGEAAAQRAIALLFNSPLSDAAAASSHIKVRNAAGKPEPGQWSLSQNPRMLMLRVAQPGRYTVMVSADLADSQGKKLGVAVQGPVYVH